LARVSRMNTRPTLESLDDRCLPSTLTAPVMGPMQTVMGPMPPGQMNMNGSAGIMPALYDGQQLNINFKEEPAQAEQSLISHNHSINTIYMSDPGLPGGQPFISVLDATHGDGFNPLWQEVQIKFSAGVTPHQFTSDTQIEAAAKAGEITLTTTTEVYRCS